VPGTVVFRGKQPSKKGRRGSFVVGVVTSDCVTLGRDAAIARILKAWGYGANRTMLPEKVARVIGFIEGDQWYPAKPMLDATAIRWATEEWKPLLFPPRDATLEGHPAVEWWVNFAVVENTPPQLTRAQLIVMPDGSTKLIETPIVDLVKR